MKLAGTLDLVSTQVMVFKSHRLSISQKSAPCPIPISALLWVLCFMFSLPNPSYFFPASPSTASCLCSSPPCFSLLLSLIFQCASGGFLQISCPNFLFSTVPYAFPFLPLCPFTISPACFPCYFFLLLFSLCFLLNSMPLISSSPPLLSGLTS